jgi:hypothetical protein
MAAKEYSSLIKEMGVTSGSGADGNSIRVEHVLILSMTEKWERALDKWCISPRIFLAKCWRH